MVILFFKWPCRFKHNFYFKAGPSSTASTVLAIPVLSSSSQTNLEKIDILNPLHIEPCSKVESLLVGSSSSHFAFPHIPLLVYTLLTIRKRAFDKMRVIN